MTAVRWSPARPASEEPCVVGLRMPCFTHFHRCGMFPSFLLLQPIPGLNTHTIRSPCLQEGEPLETELPLSGVSTTGDQRCGRARAPFSPTPRVSFLPVRTRDPLRNPAPVPWKPGAASTPQPPPHVSPRAASQATLP